MAGDHEHGNGASGGSATATAAAMGEGDSPHKRAAKVRRKTVACQTDATQAFAPLSEANCSKTVFAPGRNAQQAKPPESKSEGTLRLMIKNFSNMRDTVRGPGVEISGVPWKIMVMPRQHVMQKKGTQKCLGFFLQCCPDAYSDSWSCQASAELRLISQKPAVPNFTRKTNHVYTAKENDWGYSCFMTWAEILEEASGFIKDDRVILEVYVKAEPPKNVLTYDGFIKKIQDYMRLADLQSSRGLIDKAIEVNQSALKFCKEKDPASREELDKQKQRLIEQKLKQSIERIEKGKTVGDTAAAGVGVEDEATAGANLNAIQKALIGGNLNPALKQQQKPKENGGTQAADHKSKSPPKKSDSKENEQAENQEKNNNNVDNADADKEAKDSGRRQRRPAGGGGANHSPPPLQQLHPMTRRDELHDEAACSSGDELDHDNEIDEDAQRAGSSDGEHSDGDEAEHDAALCDTCIQQQLENLQAADDCVEMSEASCQTEPVVYPNVGAQQTQQLQQMPGLNPAQLSAIDTLSLANMANMKLTDEQFRAMADEFKKTFERRPSGDGLPNIFTHTLPPTTDLSTLVDQKAATEHMAALAALKEAQARAAPGGVAAGMPLQQQQQHQLPQQQQQLQQQLQQQQGAGARQSPLWSAEKEKELLNLITLESRQSLDSIRDTIDRLVHLAQDGEVHPELNGSLDQLSQLRAKGGLTGVNPFDTTDGSQPAMSVIELPAEGDPLDGSTPVCTPPDTAVVDLGTGEGEPVLIEKRSVPANVLDAARRGSLLPPPAPASSPRPPPSPPALHQQHQHGMHHNVEHLQAPFELTEEELLLIKHAKAIVEEKAEELVSKYSQLIEQSVTVKKVEKRMKDIEKQTMACRKELADECDRHYKEEQKLIKTNKQLRQQLDQANEKLDKLNAQLKERKNEIKKMEKKLKLESGAWAENAELQTRIEQLEREASANAKKATEEARRHQREADRLTEAKKQLQQELSSAAADVDRLNNALDEKTAALRKAEQRAEHDRKSTSAGLRDAVERAKKAELNVLQFRIDMLGALMDRVATECTVGNRHWDAETKRYMAAQRPDEAKLIQGYLQDWHKYKDDVTARLAKTKDDISRQLEQVRSGKHLGSLPSVEVKLPPALPMPPALAQIMLEETCAASQRQQGQNVSAFGSSGEGAAASSQLGPIGKRPTTGPGGTAAVNGPIPAAQQGGPAQAAQSPMKTDSGSTAGNTPGSATNSAGSNQPSASVGPINLPATIASSSGTQSTAGAAAVGQVVYSAAATHHPSQQQIVGAAQPMHLHAHQPQGQTAPGTAPGHHAPAQQQQRQQQPAQVASQQTQPPQSLGSAIGGGGGAAAHNGYTLWAPTVGLDNTLNHLLGQANGPSAAVPGQHGVQAIHASTPYGHLNGGLGSGWDQWSSAGGPTSLATSGAAGQWPVAWTTRETKAGSSPPVTSGSAVRASPMSHQQQQQQVANSAGGGGGGAIDSRGSSPITAQNERAKRLETLMERLRANFTQITPDNLRDLVNQYRAQLPGKSLKGLSVEEALHGVSQYIIKQQNYPQPMMWTAGGALPPVSVPPPNMVAKHQPPPPHAHLQLDTFGGGQGRQSMSVPPPPMQLGQQQYDCCFLCRAPLQPADVNVALKCKHRFHPQCISQHLQSKQSCPVCGHFAPHPEEYPELA